MSLVSIAGTLILEGNLTCDGEINLETVGKVIPIAHEALNTVYLYPPGKYVTANGKAPIITSVTSDINIQGFIDGEGRGFSANDGPGANSKLLDASGYSIITAGATHAGLGVMTDSCAVVNPIYGNYESPLSLGSGSNETAGGSGIKLMARSGTVNITGTINMDGQDGTTGNTGGASGGSVWLVGFDVTNLGTISAEGGMATSGNGGGGGYITIHYENSLDEGSLSVSPGDGASKGLFYKLKLEPYLFEKFTGDILNVKWWDVINDPVDILNTVDMDTTAEDLRNPLLQSKFQISGKNIISDIDFIPSGIEPSYHASYLKLCVDENNYIGLARKKNHLFGIYKIDGNYGQTGVPYDYIPTRFRINKNDATFNFQFIDSTAGPQTIFSQVIPEFRTEKFNVQVGTDKDSTESTYQVDYFNLSDADINNKFIILSTIPSEPENVTLNISEGGAQFYGYDYTTSGQYLLWDSSLLPSFDEYPLESTSIQQIQDSTSSSNIVTQWNIDQKRIALAGVSASSSVVFIVNSVPKVFGIDYILVDEFLIWENYGLDGTILLGDVYDLEYSYYGIRFEGLLPHDILISQYYSVLTENYLQVKWDNFRVWEGTIHGAESSLPEIYVDPVYGSDTSEGSALFPLQNLFVATAWAKKGGIVVLYDGTHNPTEIVRKNLTLIGANGGSPLISTANVQDSTGSNWENSCITMNDCEGKIVHLQLTGAREAFYGDNINYLEFVNCTLTDSTTGIKIVQYSKGVKILQNTFKSNGQSIRIENQALEPYIYSNVIYDTTEAIVLIDASNYTITSNTIDNATIGILLDQTSSGFIASNNLTYLTIGIDMSSDSCCFSYYNNFYVTATPYNGGTVVDSSNNLNVNPLYVNASIGDYHLSETSPDRDAGTGYFDRYYLDREGAPRSTEYDIGAYERIDGSHGVGNYYVSGFGDDFLNFGTIDSPFRTLDKAMTIADAIVEVDGGHYDSFYLKLKEEDIQLNTVTLISGNQDYAVSYVTLTETDASNKYVVVPGYLPGTSPGLGSVVLNAVKGPAQEVGVDYTVGYGIISWDGYTLENLLTEGDLLRLIYPLEVKAASVLTIDSHYSNIDLGNTLYVSPNGSDSTILGGDGTNTGGNGTYELPYRSVEMALNNSIPGSNVVVMSGEYDIFNGRDDRIIIPVSDHTGVPDIEGRKYLQSLFGSPLTTYPNLNITENSWQVYDSTDNAYFKSGYLALKGTACGADSTFNIVPHFTLQADLRQALNPLYFSVHNSDNTVIFRSSGNGDWRSTVIHGDSTRACWGVFDLPENPDIFFTDYIYLSPLDISNKYASLSLLVDSTSSMALNVVGGGSQEYGTDYYSDNNQVNWDGMNLDGELVTGDILRVIYRARDLSFPIRVRMDLSEDNILTVRGSNLSEWSDLMKHRMTGDTTSPWTVSFYMNEGVSGGKGFVSKFYVIAKEINNSDIAEQYRYKTLRQPVIMYNQVNGNP